MTDYGEISVEELLDQLQQLEGQRMAADAAYTEAYSEALAGNPMEEFGSLIAHKEPEGWKIEEATRIADATVGPRLKELSERRSRILEALDAKQPDSGLDTGHYDDGHGFGWQPPTPGPQNWTNLTGGDPTAHTPTETSADPGTVDRVDTSSPPVARIAIVTGLIVVAVVATVAITSGGDGPVTATGPSTGAPSISTGAPIADAGPVFWGNTSTITYRNKPGEDCLLRGFYVVSIVDGARFAGKMATVMLYGYAYPQRPRQDVAVRPDGTFVVNWEHKGCAPDPPPPGGVALISVDGATDVRPPPPA